MSRSLGYSGPESNGEDLESKRGQDLVANLVDIRTGSTVHWWLAFIITGDYAGSQGMSKSKMGLWNPQSGQMGSGHGTRSGRVGHMEFQEGNQGSRLEWRIEK